MSVFCLSCEKLFSTQSNLNRHTKEVHADKNREFAINYPHEVYLFKCLEGCEKSFRFNKDLRTHLSLTHNIESDYEKLIFEGKDEFQKWKTKLQVENNVEYSSASGVKRTNGDVRKMYLNCSRSGKQRIIEERKRSEKAQGSSKQNAGCTSQITLSISRTGEYVAEYFKNHYGHNLDLKHLHISENCRKNVASKLIMGVSPKHILTTVRQDIGGSLKRDDLLTIKDIGNIKTSFNICIKDGQRHKNDWKSVELYVTECQQLQEYNPILFYKKQGEPVSGFQDNDMCLIIMNSVQKELFKQFSSNIVCVDGTHGLNSYDFEMTTILVLDEFRQGFPTAFLFSNRKDQYIYEFFFENVKKAVDVEQININTLMTDVTTVYCNAWLSVMGSVTDHLYCAWHIDRAWQQNLTKVKDVEKRSWVYKTLKYLQTLLTEQDFESEIIKFFDILNSDNSTQEMYIYLKNYYYNNRQQWAYCYRKKKGINTNMFLESMHKVIKYEYLDGKKVKRLDKTLHSLQKFITDKTVDRLIKLTKGKHMKQVVDIKNRHRIALCSSFKVTEENNCFIFHEKSNQSPYLVSQTNKNICCELKCPHCNICWHTFECTCLDYQIKTMICKHIHFVVVKCIDNPVSVSNSSLQEKQSQEVQILTENINNDCSSNSSSHLPLNGQFDFEWKKQKIKNSALDIIANINNLHYSAEEYNFIIKNLNVIKSMGLTESEICIPKTKTSQTVATAEPANKNVVKQKSFFSTKKKRKSENKHSKASLEETDIIKGVLQNSLFTSKDSGHDHIY